MDQSVNKSKSLNYKTPITIFSLIALVCMVINCINYCFFIPVFHIELSGETSFVYTFEFPSLLKILFLLVDIIPCVLLVLYIIKFYKKTKAKKIMPIIFGVFILSELLSIIQSIVQQFSYDTLYYIFVLAKIITFSLATISASKGFFKKIFPIIALCIGMVEWIYHAYEAINWYLADSIIFLLFMDLMGPIAFLSLFIALLLFILNKETPPILETENAKEVYPEQALKILKDKFELGIITEEEYQAQRADIISKL